VVVRVLKCMPTADTQL